MDDGADCLHRFVALGTALITGEIELDVGGLAVAALDTGSGDQITPEVLDVLDVFGVPFELPDQIVVVLVCRVAQFLDRKSTRLNSSHIQKSRMPSSA